VKGVDLKRFREDQLLLRLNLKEEKKEKPRHVKDLYEERSRLMCEYERLRSEKRAPDFSGMTEADRAAEAERLREEAFEEARRLPEGRRRLEAEARARILDFDPKQGGIYYNSFNLADLIYRNSFSLADLYTFDLAEEECKWPACPPFRIFFRSFSAIDYCNLIYTYYLLASTNSS
jgi:hypothetical protein